MRHPTEEEWMEFLYDESPPTERREIERHAQVCPLCEAKLAEYRATTKQLSSWAFAAPPKHEWSTQWSPLIKWGAAAALLVSTAFATGRLSKPKLDPEIIEAQIARPLQEKLSKVKADLQQQVKLDTEKALESTFENLKREYAARLLQISEKTLVDAAAGNQQLRLALATLRDQDKALYAAFQELEERRQRDYRALREDLEKVALFTDESLRTAQQQIVQLASFKQSTPQ